MFFCGNVNSIVTRWLALCLGLPRFTGPTNKTKLESYCVHTIDEIMICKRNKKDSAKRRRIDVPSYEGRNANAKNFEELNSHSKESSNV